MIKRSFVASVFLHLMVLWLFSGGGPGEGESKEKIQAKENRGKSFDNRSIQDIHRPLEITVVPPPKKSGEQLAYEKFQEDLTKCEPSFGGIGISLMGVDLTLIVLEAHKYYPAERAGIRAGDLLKGISLSEIRGEVGTPVRVEVIRDGVPLTFNLIRGKICLKSTQ